MDKRDAIVYVPGLFHESGEYVEMVSRNIAAGLDRASSAECEFNLTPPENERYSDDARYTARKVTIAKEQSGKETPLIDVYEMSYGHTLIERFEKRTPIYQAFWIILTLILNLPRLLVAIRMRSKTFREKLQIAYAGLIIFIVGLYMILLLVTLFFTALDTGATFVPEQAAQSTGIATVEEQTGIGSETSNAKETPWLLHRAQAVIIILTGLGLFTKKQAKQFLSRFSAWFTGTVSYLNKDSNRSNIEGQLAQLLDYITGKSGRDFEYSNVHIVGYSFGSIVAIDALFPHNKVGNNYDAVDTLVTIGCPFDFIRTYWPTYFRGREIAAQAAAQNWLNVYIAADVLGSNFQDEHRSGSSENRGVELKTGQSEPEGPTTNLCFGDVKSVEDYGFAERVTLIGFKLHSQYWFDNPYAQDCFDLLVESIYTGDNAPCRDVIAGGI